MKGVRMAAAAAQQRFSSLLLPGFRLWCTRTQVRWAADKFKGDGFSEAKVVTEY